jgi:SAM-dependent methyltransferase
LTQVKKTTPYGRNYTRAIMTLRARNPVPEDRKVFRILDTGCGHGRLMAALHNVLSAGLKPLSVEVHGLEVAEHRGAEPDYFAGTIAALKEAVPDVDWGARLHLCSDKEPWPFPDGYFDCVVSSQVIEHVVDHQLFFAEHARVLHQHGYGVHEFPLRERIRDGHLLLRGIHRETDFENIKRRIRKNTRRGVGKYKGRYKAKKESEGFGPEDYERYQSEYVWFQLNYLSRSDALRLAKANRLKGSFILTASIVQRMFERLRLKSKPGSVLAPYDMRFLSRLMPIVPLLIRSGSGTLILEKSRLKRYGVWTDT